MSPADLHPHDTEAFREFADGVVESGTGRIDGITCYCKSGDLVPAEMSASVVELDGRPHVVNYVREATNREERDWFQALLEHSSDLITVVSGEGTILFQSASADPILGYDPAELREASLFDYLHPDDEAGLRGTLATLAEQSSAAVERREYRFRRADGTWAWLDGIVSFQPETPISGCVVNARDVTARKESQQQAMVLNRILRHNLRNNLNVIQARAEMLAEADQGVATEHVETIVENTANLRDLTRYTRDLTDMIGTHEVPQYQQDVTRLLRRQVESLREAYPSASFDLRMPESCPVTTAPKLDLAIENVLRNAVQHNDAETPRVTVTVRSPSEEYVEVVVADNGPGIPPQEREVLLEGKEDSMNHGTGLGLWMVNWIVTRSGGYISFAENEPRGSRVILVLPAGEE
jgi:PAS domain S-box-containing protein